MKKSILFILLAMFSIVTFAAKTSNEKSFKSVNSVKKSAVKSATALKELACSSTQIFTYSCPSGEKIVTAFVTVSVNCNTGAIINVDTYQTGQLCHTPFN